MRRLLLLCIVLLPLLAMDLGCGGESKPPADPNFAPTDNPSDIDISKMQKPGGGPSAPGKPAESP